MSRALERRDFEEVWEQMGLGGRSQDVVLVHSALRGFGPIAGPYAVQTVFDSFNNRLGLGAVLFPTFNFDFCATGQYNAETAPSQMGALSTYALHQQHVLRTLHPIYSFAAMGRDAWEATEASHDTRAYQGVFRWLWERDALILMLGLPWNNSFTFVHHVEEVVGCDYRYPKLFPGLALYPCWMLGCAEGRAKCRHTKVEKTRAWSMFVRDVDRGILTAINPAGAAMEQQGIAKKITLGDSYVVGVRARAAFAFIEQVLLAGTALGQLYELEPSDANQGQLEGER